MVWRQIGALGLLASSLTGCGTVVPSIVEPWDRVNDIPEKIEGGELKAIPISATAQIEFEIKKQIYCELKAAVLTVDHYSNLGNVPLIPHDWGASVSITLQVDESTAINPGVALNVPMANAVSTFGVVQKVGNTIVNPATTSTPQSFSLGFGGTVSSTATRIDKFDPYYSILYLLTPVPRRFDPNKAASEDNPDPICQFEKPTSDPAAPDGHVPVKSSPLIAQTAFGVRPLLKNRFLVDPKTPPPYELRSDVPHIVSQLGLVDWLVAATWTNEAIPSVGQPEVFYRFANYLSHERAALKKDGFDTPQITKIIASGATYEAVKSLENNYSHSDIATNLDKGVAPSTMKQYVDEGYERPEITAMLAKVKPQGASGGASMGGGGGGSSGGGGGGTAPDTLSIEIKFIIVTSGNVTPTWKLLRVSANTTGSLLSLGRTRTHDVIITIGPNNQQTLNTHLASQIGNAVSNGNQAAALSTQ